MSCDVGSKGATVYLGEYILRLSPPIDREELDLGLFPTGDLDMLDATNLAWMLGVGCCQRDRDVTGLL